MLARTGLTSRWKSGSVSRRSTPRRNLPADGLRRMSGFSGPSAWELIRQPALDCLGALPEGWRVDAGPVALVPALEGRLRQGDRDRVVDHGRPADAASLQDGEAEVLALLEDAVGVELSDHLHLISIELPRFDVLAALEDDHVLSRLRQAVGEDRAGGTAADDANVRLDLRLLDGLGLFDLERVLPRCGDLAGPVESGVALALGEGLIAHGRETAPVAVVADVGELVGHAQHHLHVAAQRLRREQLQPDRPIEPGVEVLKPALLVQLGEGRLEGEDRMELHREQPDAVEVPAAGADPGEVAIHVGDDVSRRDRLLGALDDHLRERDQRPVLRWSQKLRPKPPVEGPPAQECQGNGDDKRGCDHDPKQGASGRIGAEKLDLLVELRVRQAEQQARDHGGKQRERERGDQRQAVTDISGDVPAEGACPRRLRRRYGR